MAEDRFERVTNLVTFLLDRERGATFAEILEQIPGWPEGVEARRRAFERDKRVLRDEGIPLVEDGGRYRIPPEQYYLPELELSESERLALRLAVAAVPLGGESTGLAVHKLTLGAGSADALAVEGGAAPVALGDTSDLLPLLHRAVRDRSVVTILFRGEERVVEPSLLFFRDGHWYLTGHDRARDDRRSFRLDRVTSVVSVGEPGGFERAGAVESDEAIPREPWLVGGELDEAVTAVVEVDAVLAAKAAAEVGGDVERMADGGVRVTLRVTNVENFRAWVLGMLDHAVVVSPPSLRDEIVRALEAMA